MAMSKPGTEQKSALRICHLAYTFYENDNRVIRYAEAMAHRGHQVDVIALRRSGQSTSGVSKGVRIYRIQRRAINERWAWAYLLKILTFLTTSTVLLGALQVRRRYDVVHVHNVPDFLVFAALVPRLMGARIILDIHDIVPELYAGKFGSRQESLVFRSLLLVERLSCAFADHVIVANHLWYDKLIRRTVSASKCTPILNHPDLSLFGPPPDSSRRRDDRFIMLYPGTLNHHQGLDIAIRAFGLVRDQMPTAELHIYGEGPARAGLQQLTRELGLVDRVRIMDRVPLSEVSGVMGAADVGVVPKRADGFGNEAFSTKILEFMACGVPVIVSRTQIDAHYFDDTLVRFFVPGEETDLGRVMLEVYEHRLQHDVWVRTARDFAVLNSWQEHVVDYFRVIESLVGPSAFHEAIAE